MAWCIVLWFFERRIKKREVGDLMKYVDLTQNIEDDMNVHPYDLKVKLYQDKHYKEDGYNNFVLNIGTHAGTHIDSPMHISDNGKYINEYDIEKFCGKTIMFEVIGIKTITPSYIEVDKIKDEKIVLFYTGFDKKYGSDEYYLEHPTISMELAKVLVSKGIKIIGVDTPSPDKYPFDVHKYLFKNEVFIVENLTNLSEVVNKEKVEVFLFPLKIKADASLVRAVAKVEWKRREDQTLHSKFKIRLASSNDLDEINVLFRKVIDNLENVKKISMWNEVYPFCEFEEDIKNHRIYLMEKDNKIIGSFTIDDFDDPDCDVVKWKFNDKKWFYLSRLVTLPFEQRQGYAKIPIEFIQKYAVENEYEV